MRLLTGFPRFLRLISNDKRPSDGGGASKGDDGTNEKAQTGKILTQITSYASTSESARHDECNVCNPPGTDAATVSAGDV